MAAPKPGQSVSEPSLSPDPGAAPSSSGGPVARPATIDDAAEIARCHVAAWLGAYRGLIPDEHLDALDAGEGARRWRETFARASALTPGAADFGDAPCTVLVVEDEGGDVVGVCAVGASRDPDLEEVGELWMINLAPEAWGKGLGRLLIEAAEGVLAGLGYREAYLWVLRDNARARGFYERMGWHWDGTAEDRPLRDYKVAELRYRTTLGD